MPTINSVLTISVGGIFMLFVGTCAVAYFEQYFPFCIAAIIVATVPLWFVLLDKRHWKTNFANKKIILGLLLGFIGVLLLFAGKRDASVNESSMRIISFIVLIIGTIGWAIGSLYSKYK